MFNAALLAEETRVPRETHKPAIIHWQTLSHNVVSSTPHQLSYDHHDDGARNECKHRGDAHY